MEPAIVVHPGREVADMNRNRRAQLDVPLDTGAQGLSDPRVVPFRIVVQQIVGQRLRLLNADASVTERASGAREQFVSGRVVEVDVEGVWKHELDIPERVARARTLSERQL